MVYAFCRHVDDAADKAESSQAGGETLLQIRRELRGERAAGPVVGAFLSVAGRRRIEVAHAEELVLGVASDLGEVRIEDDRALIRYSYRVAGTVGLLMCPVLGVTVEAAHPFAVDLGVGMQLTNICRDVAEDAQMGRVYLPRSRLMAHGVTSEMLLASEASANYELRRCVAQVVRELVALADVYYASGALGMNMIPPQPRIAMVVASRVYRAIGHKLVSQGADPWRGRTVLTGKEKVWSAIRGLVGLMLRQLPGRKISKPCHQAGLHAPLAGLPGTNPPSVLAIDDDSIYGRNNLG